MFASQPLVLETSAVTAALRSAGSDGPDPTSGGRFPFVGRKQALAEFESAIGRARGGNGALLLLGGEPGIGKTRLAHEMALQARNSGMRVLWGTCWEHQGTPAFWPWTQILRGAARELESESMRPSYAHRYAAIQQLAPALARVDTGNSEVIADTAPANRFSVLDGFSSWLRRAAMREPILLVLDDLQWADEASLDLLRFLTAEVRDQAVVLLGTYRDVEVDGTHPHAPVLAELTAKAVPIALPGLSLSEVRELAANVGGLIDDDERMRMLHARTGGNPLFVAELLRMGGAEPDTCERSMTASVRQVLEDRCKRLSDACRKLLSVASVIGPEFSISMLSHVLRLLGQEHNGLRGLLDEAVSARLLDRAEGAEKYRFGHALVREACYAMQSEALTRTLHRRVAQAIQDRHADDLDGRHAQLAFHHERAGAPEDLIRAASHLERAGQHGNALSAYGDAATHFRRALALLEQLGSADRLRRCGLLLELGAAEMNAGQSAQGRETLERAAAIAAEQGDGELLARAALCFGVALAVGRIDLAEVELLNRALRLLDASDSPLRASLLARLATALMFGAQDARCLELADAALAMARRLGHPGTLARVLISRHQTLWNGGFAEERLRIAEEGIALADAQHDARLALELRALRLGDLLELGDIASYRLEVSDYADRVATRKQVALGWHAELHRATLAMLEGRFEQAERFAAQGLVLGRRFQHPGIELFHASIFLTLRFLQRRSVEVIEALRGFVDAYPALCVYRAALAANLSEAGRLEDARVHFEVLAAAGFSPLPRDFQRIGCMALLSGVCHQLGDAVRAQELYQLMLPYRRYNVRLTRNGTSTLGTTEHFLGMLALTARRWDHAVTHLQAAVDTHRRQGFLPMLANSQQLLGRALLARAAMGDHARAELELRRARVLADNLELAFLFQAERPADSDGNPIPNRQPASQPDHPSATTSLAREGEYWLLQHAGSSMRLRDSVGMQLLAHLLSEPEREFSALELRAGPDASRRAHSDAGPVLDERAMSAYRAKCRELAAEITEADQWGDLGRAARARDVLGALEQQLSQAIGLGGRQRRAASSLERARVAATKAIRAAVRKVAREHAALGAHLERSIRTGHVCSYSPDPATALNWSVQRH